MDIEQIHDKFKINIDELINNNSLYAVVKLDENKFHFMIKSASQTYRNDKNRFHPNSLKYYEILFKQKINDTHLDYFFTNMENKEFLTEFVTFIKSEDCNTDKDIIDVFKDYDPENYLLIIRLLYFTIFSNQIGFNQRFDIEIPNIYIFNCSVNLEKKREFESISGPSTILFHGTSFLNMYSMMRNGIREMSKTKYMSAGNAFGDGIYLSDLFQFSSTYSGYNSTDKIVLIYEVKNLKNKAVNIFVQQENEVCLRGIVWITDEKINSDITSIIINNFRPLESSIIKRVDEFKEVIGSLTVKEPKKEPVISWNSKFEKRILTELNDHLNNDDTLKTMIKKKNYLNPENNKTPLLIEMYIPNDTKLYKQGEKYGISISKI